MRSKGPFSSFPRSITATCFANNGIPHRLSWPDKLMENTGYKRKLRLFPCIAANYRRMTRVSPRILDCDSPLSLSIASLYESLDRL